MSYVLGIAGAGVMGRGIALCAVRAGLDVVLVDARGAALDDAKRRLHDELRLTRMLARGTPALPGALGQIAFTVALDEIARADFVVESIVERPTDKERLFRALDERCPAAVCFASNTSAIPIARLAAATRREPQVLGLHFMSPAPLTSTVELVRAPRTAGETVAAARDLLTRLGKQCIEVRDGPGFVSNRVLMLAINEAAALAAEGAAPPADIDRVLTACLGHAMGPLATADLIGIDVIVDTLVVLAELAGARYRPHPLLVDLVERGRLGCKTGAGFFTYPEP
jgi:3-hydroxyacyl-CoA dehydrogenase